MIDLINSSPWTFWLFVLMYYDNDFKELRTTVYTWVYELILIPLADLTSHLYIQQSCHSCKIVLIRTIYPPFCATIASESTILRSSIYLCAIAIAYDTITTIFHIYNTYIVHTAYVLCMYIYSIYSASIYPHSTAYTYIYILNKILNVDLCNYIQIHSRK